LEHNAVVTQKVEVAPGLYIMRLAAVGWQLPSFKPGQFAVLGLPASSPRHPLCDLEEPADDPDTWIRRSYSIASSSREGEYMEIYLTLVRSGSMSPRLALLNVGDRLWLGRKVSGLFTFDEVPKPADLVMIATGTGLAPYMSMLRTTLDEPGERRLAVIHGARHSWDLGYRGELLTMERLRPKLVYLPVVSRPAEEPVPWTGEAGYVQDVWRRRVLDARWGHRPDPAVTHVFLCGNPGMIDTMVRILEGEGFREHTRLVPGQIHYEKYW
jgi:ferredoxin--NADP+ reductase